MGCCRQSNGAPRAITYISFAVVNDAGVEVEEWPSFHEARVAVERLGAGFRVETRRRAIVNPD